MLMRCQEPGVGMLVQRFLLRTYKRSNGWPSRGTNSFSRRASTSCRLTPQLLAAVFPDRDERRRIGRLSGLGGAAGHCIHCTGQEKSSRPFIQRQSDRVCNDALRQMRPASRCRECGGHGVARPRARRAGGYPQGQMHARWSRRPTPNSRGSARLCRHWRDRAHARRPPHPAATAHRRGKDSPRRAHPVRTPYPARARQRRRRLSSESVRHHRLGDAGVEHLRQIAKSPGGRRIAVAEQTFVCNDLSRPFGL